jgi:hypothetical protein
MPLSKTMILLVFILCSALGCSSNRPAGSVTAPIMVETDKGKIKGSRYQLAKPQHWNGKILLVAPGWRPPDSKLIAPLNTQAPFESTLLKDGWLVVTTSYRRTGLIIEDGIEDLQKLVRRIEKHYGAAEFLVIEGSSMGGAIGVLIAEGDFFPQHLKVGVLAFGVDLEEPGEAGPLPLTHIPNHPLLLMSNRSEWASPLDYARQSPWTKNRPALWFLERDGHVNLNSAERLLAVAAMDHWLISGERPQGAVPFGLDVTVDMSDRPSTSQELPNGYRVKVTGIDPIYGNVETEMVLEDFQWMLKAQNQGFNARGGASRFVKFGTTYSDVGAGSYVAFLSAEGYVHIARNMGNAAKGLRCQVGDYLEITVDDPADPLRPSSRKPPKK